MLLVEAYANAGWYHNRLGHFQDSVEASREALRIDPKQLEARFNLALTLLQSGQPEEALEEYRKGLGGVKLASDLKYLAIEDLEQALRENPNLPQGEQVLQMLKSQHEEMLRTLGMDKAGLPA